MKSSLFSLSMIIGILASSQLMSADSSSLFQKETTQLVGLIATLQVHNLSTLLKENAPTEKLSPYTHESIIEALPVLDALFGLEKFKDKNTSAMMAPFPPALYYALMHIECSQNDSANQKLFKLYKLMTLRLFDSLSLVLEHITQALDQHSLPVELIDSAILLKTYFSELLAHDSDCACSAYLR